MSYKDKHGETISYGDVLKIVDYKRENENEPKEPFITLVKQDGEDMLYVSGMDEYQEIEDWQTEEDKKNNTISQLEIFCNLNTLYKVAIRKLPFDAVLTFDEVKAVNKLVEESIEKKNYGYVPCVSINFIPDEEDIDFQNVEICTINALGQAYMKAKETGILISPYKDITDEMKRDVL